MDSWIFFILKKIQEELQSHAWAFLLCFPTNIFDSTHAEGKSNALLLRSDSQAVIPGLNDILSLMQVGEKVQAIIPPSLAFGSEGICVEKEDGTKGECLISLNST